MQWMNPAATMPPGVAMNELIQTALSPTVLPLTVLAGACFLYWIMVFAGLIEAELIDFGSHFEFDVDPGLDGDADLGADHGAGHDGSAGGSAFGGLYAFRRF